MPVGTKITYACPKLWVFKENPYVVPTKTVECKDDGKFSGTDNWPTCADIFSTSTKG